MLHVLYRRLSLLIAILLLSTSLYAGTVTQSSTVQQQLATLETTMGGQIGVSTIDLATNNRLQYRAAQRFPMCSTFKVMVVAAILKQSETIPDLLQQRITYKRADLVFYSPITEKHLTEGMTIAELCAAAMMFSDNTATNLLLKKLGGPQAVTAFAHSIGDKDFRSDRFELEMSSAVPGDQRDTSTPAAMANSLQRLVLGNVLALTQREQLQTWLKNNTTGDKLIRASVPKSWTVGDKSGGGGYGTRNDIAIIWPPHCAPIIMVIYTTQDKKQAQSRDDVVAGVARIILDEFAQANTCIKTDIKEVTK